MKFHHNLGIKEIFFEVFEDDSNLLDQLAFIYLIEMKFDGEVTSISSFEGVDCLNIHIKLQFPNWEKSSDAYAHCNRNLDGQGKIVQDYIGALNTADPRRRMAKKLEKRAKENS